MSVVRDFSVSFGGTMLMSAISWRALRSVAVKGAILLYGGLLVSYEQSAANAAEIEELPKRAIADYQLGGAYPPVAGVNVVARDSAAEPAPGLYNICYVNGFQTQPGVPWPRQLLLQDRNGGLKVDPNWPDEHLLDISSEQNRRMILERQRVTISRCADAGFNAVEFDNLDSFTRSKGALKREDAIAFATLLVQAAHQRGLAAAQKNTPDLTGQERTAIGFDFVVSEECHRFDECSEYTRFYGDRVINIEYTDNLRGRFSDVCAASATPRNTVLRDRKLLPASQKGHRFSHCLIKAE